MLDTFAERLHSESIDLYPEISKIVNENFSELLEGDYMNNNAHYLKITSHWFSELSHGKNFEVRKNDRNYQTGDVLNIYVPETMETVSFRVTYVLTSEQFPDGIKDGYCILGIKEIV